MKKQIKIAALAVLSVLCVATGANALTLSAKADDSVLVQNKAGITMAEGASVRYKSTTEGEEEKTNTNDNGLRFEMLISTDAYVNIKEAYDSVTFGMLIAPATYEKFTLDNVFGADAEAGKKYDWAVWNGSEYIYDSASEYTRIINVSTTVDFSESNLTTVEKENADGTTTTYYHYYGSITGIQESNLAREFMGVGYVTANGETVLTEYKEENARSIAYVAQKALADSEANISDGGKKWIEKNYVETVEAIETTYTVQYMVADNVTANGKALLFEKEFKANIGTESSSLAYATDGLTVNATAVNSSTVYANGKTTVIADCTLDNDYEIEALSETTGYLWKTGRVYYITDDSKATAESTSYGAINVIFVNQTNETATVSVSGGYGAVAILDKNGVVVEGRDGANGKLVNAANPVRTTSTATISTTAFAQSMVIPAGGYAIVIQNSLSDFADYLKNGERVKENTAGDLRNTLNNSFIAEYGKRAQISVSGIELTQYQAGAYAKASYITPNIKYSKAMANATALANVKVYDDNGTFDSADDILLNPELSVTGNTNLTVAGTYTVAMQAKISETETISFYRGVKVVDTLTVTVGESVFTTTSGKFVVDTQAQSTQLFYGSPFRFYTSAYSKDTTALYCSNGYGAALIIDKEGKVVKAYDAGGAYYTDNSGTSAGTVSISSNMNAIYTEWYNNYRSQGGYLLIAPNDTVNASDGARQFLRNIVKTACGQTVTISYYDF